MVEQMVDEKAGWLVEKSAVETVADLVERLVEMLESRERIIDGSYHSLHHQKINAHTHYFPY